MDSVHKSDRIKDRAKRKFKRFLRLMIYTFIVVLLIKSIFHAITMIIMPPTIVIIVLIAGYVIISNKE